MSTTQAPLETFRLGQFTVPRLFHGFWQLSSNAWGSAPSPKIRRHMAQYAEQGYIAFGTCFMRSTLLSLTHALLRRHGESTESHAKTLSLMH